MQVRFYCDVEIPDEDMKDMSESYDVVLYGVGLLKTNFKMADSLDDIMLKWEEINRT